MSTTRGLASSTKSAARRSALVPVRVAVSVFEFILNTVPSIPAALALNLAGREKRKARNAIVKLVTNINAPIIKWLVVVKTKAPAGNGSTAVNLLR